MQSAGRFHGDILDFGQTLLLFDSTEMDCNAIWQDEMQATE